MENKQKRAKILYVITKSNWGGAQRYVYDLATSFTERGYEVAVVCGGNGLLIKKLKEKNIPIIAINSFQRDINLWKELRSFFELLKIFNRERPDVVHLNSSKAGGLGALAARIVGVPRVIFTAHGWPFREERFFLSKLLIWLASWATQFFAHATIAVSKLDARDAPIPSTTKLIRNGIDVTSLSSRTDAQKELDLPKDALVVGTIGELNKNKNHRVLLPAFAHILEKHAESELCIISDGELKDQLVRQAESNDTLKDKFIFRGFVPNASMYLKAFDIFVLPSLKEGLPYVLLEAGHAELPTVASNTGGIPEIIVNGKTGLLVEPNNIDQLADALEELIQNEGKRKQLGAALEKRVREHFSFEKMLKQTLEVYTLHT